SRDKKVELFPDKSLSYTALKSQKNEILHNILRSLEEIDTNTTPMKLEDRDGEFFLFKIAQKEQTIITHNFKNKQVNNEPYVYVISNNDKNVQKIAISENFDAFSTTPVVKNLLKAILRKELSKHGLNIEVEHIFSSISFWEFIKT